MSTESSAPGCDRRAFLRAAAGALPLATMLGRLSAAGTLAKEGTARVDDRPALIVRQQNPENLEFPFASLDSFITPNERFYVRNHFPAPKIEKVSCRLKELGPVEKNLELSYDQILALPATTMKATLECAGNGRAFLVPKAKGVAWQLGAVSTAEWTGVKLATVLEQAGLKRDAVEVILE